MATVVYLRPTTVALYQQELNHILARFGQTPIGRFDPWLSQLLAGGMAASSVHRKYRVLRRLLEVGVEKGVIPVNPCARVKPPAVENNELRFLTPGELVGLAGAIDHWYRPFVYTAAETGMRWSELVGLRRGRVDLLRRSIAVTEQLVFISGDSSTGRDPQWIRQKPKTKAGTRSITISSFLAGRLEDQMTHRAGAGRDGLVFVNHRGEPIGRSIFHRRHWQPARAAVGLDDLRFHDLRHTAVALAISQGAHPKAVQRRMGHSSINMTLDRYGHLFPEPDENIADDVGAVLARAHSATPVGTVTAIR